MTRHLFVLASLVLILALSASGAVDDATPDYCGDGPVEIEIHKPTTGCNTTTCEMFGTPETGYTEVCYTTTLGCVEIRTERWTDYPECGGKRIDD